MKQINFKLLKGSFYLIPFLLLGLMIGCNSNSTAPPIGNFSLSIQKAPGPSNAAGSDTLFIDTVKIMMKNVELFSESSGEGEEHEDSEEVELGPFVIDLNLNGSVNTIALTNVPEGTYNGVKFEIHRLNRNEASLDSEFIDSTCGERGYSLIVKGSYFGNPFVYKSRKSFNQHVFFTNPITVTNNGLINVTLTVDPYSWFIKNGTYLDPSDQNNYWLINNLIRSSFQNYFRNDDHHGHHDH
jgi:hypothetical protein